MSATYRSPAAPSQVLIVHSFEELVSTPFSASVNALCWQRELAGDYDALARLFAAEDDIVSLDEESLGSLSLEGGARIAAAQMIADLQLLRERGLLPSLECVPSYPRDDADAIVPVDVYSFHADRAPVPTDTYLCSYNQIASEGMANENARRHIDIPETRAKLLELFHQDGGDDFETYLRDNCFDLHFAALPGAVPYSFGLGNLWRIAVDYPSSPALPCIHRAPQTAKGQLPRLLLIS